MKNHFVIVAGYLDTDEKTKMAIDFIEKLRKIENISICYSTHHSNIPQKLIELTDFIVYNKYNPILNWDICSEYTERFGVSIQEHPALDKEDIFFPQPYHGYAHLISLCDAVAIGTNTGYKTFSFMNFDVVDYCIDQLPLHIEEIKKDMTDAIFYPYLIQNINSTVGSTEFFTFGIKFAQEIYKYRDFRHYQTIHDPVLERFVNLVCKSKGLKWILIENKFSENGTLGKLNFGKGDMSKVPFWVPYETIWDGDKRFEICILPFKVKNKYQLVFAVNSVFSDYDEDMKEIRIFADDKQLKNDWELHTIQKPCRLKITYKNKITRDFVLNDERHFGKVRMKVRKP